MFDLIKCAENTYYLKCYANIGVYHLGGSEVILIDSGDHKKSVRDLDEQLCQRGWRVSAIYNTHSHLDHIHGNDYFREKYGCKIYSSQTERNFIDALDLERTVYFAGVPSRHKFDPCFTAKHEPVGLLSEQVMPQGFETVELPGHTFNMIGIKTPDDVWFTGDAVLAKETYDSYKLPFFLLTNQSIEAAKRVSELSGKFFVPSHAEPSESIRELALYNVQRLTEIKELVYSLCDHLSVEQILAELDRLLGMDYTVDKYTKVRVMLKGVLQGLIDDSRIDAAMDESKTRLVYFKK